MSRLLALFLVALAFIGFLATTSYRVPAQNDRRWTKPPRSIEREPGSPRGVLNGRRPKTEFPYCASGRAPAQPKTDKQNIAVSVRDRPLIGVTVLLNMNPSDTSGQWIGKIYNAEDGNTYVGSFTIYDANTAQLKACVLGGLVCKQQMWTRTAAPSNETPTSGAVLPSKVVSLKKAGGTFVVPVQINGAITLDFTVDSGASDVSIPADVFSTLARTGTVKDSDIVGEQIYKLADGSKTKSTVFTIRSLKLGDRIVENVRGSVAPPQGSLLLGQSFLERFKSWSIDNTRHVLLLEPQ
jgi:clan AA aspartic protease (TIGR02281 family)